MYFLRMGSICALLSDVFVNSFTCGAGVHIFTSQVKSILGVSTQRYSGPFQLIKVRNEFVLGRAACKLINFCCLQTYAEMVANLIDSDKEAQTTTIAAVSISAGCIIALLFSAYVIKV